MLQLEDILRDIKGETPVNPYLKTIARPTGPQTKIENNEVQDVRYDVHRDAIFDRLNDGTYIPKFENYAGAIGNEDRLAQQQTGFTQLTRGVTKAGIKTFNYALDATAGTVYGIFNAISEGKMEGLYDNDFSNKLDDWNKRLDNNLVNYYSDEQKSMGVLRSMATVNFWANDVAGGFAFVAGALLPEIAIAAATGGASAPASLAKIGLKLGLKGLVKKGGKEVVEAGARTLTRETLEQTGKQLIRGQRLAKVGEYTGEAFKTGGFIARTSNFEAGMEARHNLHDATSEFLNNFKELNGRNPTNEEYSDFMDNAVTASNYVYGANMAILSVSNVAMFGAKFGVGVKAGKEITNSFNKIIGLGVDKTVGGEIVKKATTRTQKFLGNSYLVLGKAATEGLYEEGLQGVAGKTMQNYLKTKYDPDTEQGYGMWSSMTDAFAEQYGTKEGWKEMAIGMIIGMGAPVMMRQKDEVTGKRRIQAPDGFGKNSRKSREAELIKGIEAANSGRQEILKNLDRANGMAIYRNRMESGDMIEEDTSISNTIINTEFIKTQEQFKSVSEVKEDFEAIVDNMEFTSEQEEALGGKENVPSYKSFLKENFNQDANNYKVARSIVSSIGLDGKLKNTPGNLQEIGESLTMSIMVGKSSLSKAKALAEQIDSYIGTEGIFNHIEHYNGLDQTKRDKIEDIKKKKRRLNDLRKLAVKAGKQLNGITVEGQREFSTEKKTERYERYSKDLVLTQTAITELETEIEQAKDALESDFRAENFNIDGTVTVDTTTLSVDSMIEEMDKLDTYMESLKKSGRKQEADVLASMVTDFKTYSDAHRQMNSDIRSMFDTNFFKGERSGKIQKTLLGPSYQMSEETIQLIRENEDMIDSSMRKSGLKGYDSVQEALEATITENEELSDREKYRRESLIRMILGAKRLQNTVENAQKGYQEIIESTQLPSDKNPLNGDTIRLSRVLNPEGKDLNNLELINQMISDITSEIGYLRGSTSNQEKITRLEKEIQDLKNRLTQVIPGSSTEVEVEDSEDSKPTVKEQTDAEIADLEAQKQAEIEAIRQKGSRATTSNQSEIEVQKADIGKRRKEDLNIGIPLNNYLSPFRSPKESLIKFREYLTDVLGWEKMPIGYTKPNLTLTYKSLNIELEIPASIIQLGGNVSDINLQQQGGGSLNLLEIDIKDVINAKYDAELINEVKKGNISLQEAKEIIGNRWKEEYDAEIAALESKTTEQEISDVTDYYDQKINEVKAKAADSSTQEDATAKALEEAVRDSPINFVEEEDGRVRMTGGSIEVRNEAKKADKIQDVKTPSSLYFLPKKLTLSHLSRNQKDKNNIIKNGFDLRQVSIDSPIKGVYFSSEDWSSMDRFGRTKEDSVYVDIDNDGLLYFDSTESFRDYLKENGLPYRGETLSDGQIQKLKDKGIKGILLREDFASQSRNELIVIDDSIIKNIAESPKDITKLPSSFSDMKSISEAYHKAKADGSNPELVKAVEDLIGKPTAQEAEKATNQGEDSNPNGSNERVESGEKDIPKTEQEILQQEIDAKEAELTKLKEGNSYTIVTSKEYLRLEELLGKKQNGTITQEEEVELQEVTDDINDWALITGTVVEGLSLADLILQKNVLENTEVIEYEEVNEITDREVIEDAAMSEVVVRSNYAYSQTYDAVTAVATKKGIEVSGVRPEEFSEIAGTSDFTINKIGNIIITEDVRKEINSRGRISILPSNANLTSNYSIVLETLPNMDGEAETSPLTSTFNSDFNGEMRPEAVYDMENGEEVIMEVNSQDAYNQELLEAYRNARSGAGATQEQRDEALSEDTIYQDLLFELETLQEQEKKATTDKKPGITKKKNKKKEAVEKRRKSVEIKVDKGSKGNTEALNEAIEAIKVGLVVRVKNKDGILVAVLKGKRNIKGVKTTEDIQFEAIRDQIGEDTEYLDRLADTNATEEIPLGGSAKVANILIGHPTFNYTVENGTFSIDSKGITEIEAKKVIDVGYIQNGKITTKSKDREINTTFVKKTIDQSSTGKIPFIVIQKGNIKFAYPVKLNRSQAEGLSEFRDIYNSDASVVSKVNALNKFMAERGINIRETGNSFTVFDLKRDGTFFESKMAQLETLGKKVDLDTWADPHISIESNLVGNASINIDLSNPLHSPKLKLDYAGVKIKKTAAYNKAAKLVDDTPKKVIKSGSGVDNFLNQCK